MEEEKTKIKKDLFRAARGQKVNSKNRGITLVALVITIVVLIILAAVAINLSLGNNGIFNRAKTAKEQYQNAESYEKTEIAKVTNEVDSFSRASESLNDEFITIDFTSPSSLATWTKIADYPTGYNYNNCIIVGGYVEFGTIAKYSVCGGVEGAYFINTRLTSSGIELGIWTDSGFLNKSGKIILKKVN